MSRSAGAVSGYPAPAGAHQADVPLLADGEPKGRRRGPVLATVRGADPSQRAVFVPDDGGVIRWCEVASATVAPGADGVLTARARLGGAAPT